MVRMVWGEGVGEKEGKGRCGVSDDPDLVGSGDRGVTFVGTIPKGRALIPPSRTPYSTHRQDITLSQLLPPPVSSS